MLSQLVADNVQGPGIAQPMPPEQVVGWIALRTLKNSDYRATGTFGDIADNKDSLTEAAGAGPNLLDLWVPYSVDPR